MTWGDLVRPPARPRTFSRARFLFAVLAIVVAAMVFPACRGHETRTLPEPRETSFDTADGLTIVATLYPAVGERAPGLVLVHAVGSDRSAWDAFARRAQLAGYSCMAFDLRGHGASVHRGSDTLSYRAFDTLAWKAAVADIAAAWDALVAAGADPADMAVVGASMGANLALEYAAAHPDVPAIVMVSPGLDYKGVQAEETMRGLGRRPVLLMASRGDSYSASSCNALEKAGSGLCELREYDGAAHGTALFDLVPTAIEQVLLWLHPIIGGSLPPLD